jgi:hypothetical protein
VADDGDEGSALGGGGEGVEGVVHWDKGEEGGERGAWKGSGEGWRKGCEEECEEGCEEGYGEGDAVHGCWCDGEGMGYCAEDDGNDIIFDIQGYSLGMKSQKNWYRGCDSCYNG